MFSIFLMDAVIVLAISGIMNIVEILQNKKIERLELEARYVEE